MNQTGLLSFFSDNLYVQGLACQSYLIGPMFGLKLNAAFWCVCKNFTNNT